MSSARERLTTLLYGPMMSVRPEQRILISGIVEACAAVADEPTNEGETSGDAIRACHKEANDAK